jgi:hypothetical protein
MNHVSCVPMIITCYQRIYQTFIYERRSAYCDPSGKALPLSLATPWSTQMVLPLKYTQLVLIAQLGLSEAANYPQQ